jgi:hypothetical protein
MIRPVPQQTRRISRRTLLRVAGTAPLLAFAACTRDRAPAVASSRPTDIRIVEVNHNLEEFQ